MTQSKVKLKDFSESKVSSTSKDYILTKYYSNRSNTDFRQKLVSLKPRTKSSLSYFFCSEIDGYLAIEDEFNVEKLHIHK